MVVVEDDTHDDDVSESVTRVTFGGGLSASWPCVGLTVPTREEAERLQMLADRAVKGSPSLRRRGSNVSSPSNDTEDDLDELKILGGFFFKNS